MFSRKILSQGLIIIASVAIIGAILYSSIVSNQTGKDAVVNTEVAVPTTPIFQPEAQMLSQAIAPDGAAALKSTEIKSKATSSPKFTDTMNSAPKKSATPSTYVYAQDPCGQVAGGVKHFSCFEKYYQDLVANYSVDVAFEDLQKRYDANPFVATQCHPLTHVIGRKAVDRYPTASEAYLHGNSFCWSGYFHGVMEGVVEKIGEANLPTQINSICADIPGKSSYTFDYYNCVHGLGHGVMELQADDVFSSLTMCDNLTGSWERESCYGGVYMENIIAYNRDGVMTDLKLNDPMYPCNAVEDKYKGQCYLGQTSFALQLNGYDFKKTFDLCATVVGMDGAFRNICNQSIGRDAANVARHDSVSTRATCYLTTDATDRTNCIVGAVKEIISYYHSDVQAAGFCTVLDEVDRAHCQTIAESYYKVF